MGQNWRRDGQRSLYQNQSLTLAVEAFIPFLNDGWYQNSVSLLSQRAQDHMSTILIQRLLRNDVADIMSGETQRREVVLDLIGDLSVKQAYWGIVLLWHVMIMRRLPA